MGKEHFLQLASQWADGTISPEDLASLQNWMAESDENRQAAEEVKLILGAFDLQMEEIDPETDKAWAALSAHIAEAKSPKVIQMNPAPKRSGWVYGIAATIALLMAVGGYIMFGGGEAVSKGSLQDESYATVDIERKTVKLADGTTVSLNSGTKLIAKAGFGGKERRVTLTGEAYFEVAKDPSKPFIVEMGDVETTVLGTQFNLRQYRPEDPINLDVTEGKVKFASAKDQQEGIFLANESGVFDPKAKKITKRESPISDPASWMSGVLSFQDEALTTAIPRLNHFYDIDIRLGNGLEDARLTARFAEKDEAALLDILATTFSAKVRREGKVFWLEK